MDIGMEAETFATRFQDGPKQVGVVNDGERDQEQVERVPHGLPGQDVGGQRVAKDPGDSDDAQNDSLEPEGKHLQDLLGLLAVLRTHEVLEVGGVEGSGVQDRGCRDRVRVEAVIHVVSLGLRKEEVVCRRKIGGHHDFSPIAGN